MRNQRRRYLTRATACLVMALAASVAAIPAIAAPEPGVETQPEVTRATLENGLRVVIVRNTLAPVVTTQMNYLVGSDEAPEDFPGTAHALEHMMFRGSPGLDKDQISALAANMGGRFNAQTTEGVTQYFFTVPAQDLDVALRIDAIRMRGLYVAPEEWASERGAIEQEVSRDMSSPTFKLYTDLRARMFENTPYAHTPLGTKASFDETTAAALKSFHDAWYAPNNAILVIAGDVDPPAALDKVRALFSDIPAKQLPARIAFELQPVEANTVTFPSDFPYGLALIAYRLPSLRDEDYAAALVLSQAMGSKRGRLFEMGLSGAALYGGFSSDFLPQGGLAYAEGVFPRGEAPDGVLHTIHEIMADTVSGGVPADLVEAAKRTAIADLEYRKNSVEGLASAWSQALAFAGASSPDDVRDAIASVTPLQVNALARRLFDPTHAITAIVTPEDSGNPVGGQGFGGAEAFGGEPTGPVTLPDWAQAAFAKLDVPESSVNPSSFTLANGLRLIVQPETVSRTVEVFGRVKTNEDVQAADGKEGVANVLEDMFDFGTANMDRQQFQTALDEISAHESAGQSFSLAVPTDGFARGMELLADNQLHPAMPDDAFKRMQQREAAQAAGAMETPAFRNTLALYNALLPRGDPELRYATAESIGRLTLADVKDYHAKAFRPDMTTIVVIGDVTPEQARQVVEQTFGQWQATGPKPETDYPAVPLNAAAARFDTPAATAVQASATMAQQIAITDRSDDRFALQAGNLVLSGGFYSARLTRDLRAQRGLVYTVDSGLDLDRNRGRFEVAFGSDPDKVAEAHDMVVRDLKEMQDAPISAEELLQVKSMLLRQLPLSQSSFDSIAGRLLQFSLADKPLDSDAIAARRYAALTADQIQATFRQYIRPDAFVTAVLGPAPVQ